MAEIRIIRFDSWGDFKRDLAAELFPDRTYRPGDYGVEIVSAPSLHNVRARNQSGFFTWSRSPFNSLEEFVAGCTAVPGTALTQVLLPVDEVRPALADLDLMGISALHLFPDLS